MIGYGTGKVILKLGISFLNLVHRTSRGGISNGNKKLPTLNFPTLDIPHSVEWKAGFSPYQRPTYLTSKSMLFWLLLNVLDIKIIHFSFIFVIIPQLISDSTSMVVSNSTNFQVTDIITGSGYLEDTVLFYGAYTNNTVQIGDWNYQISSAYFYTVLIVYMVTFITIAIR